MNGPPTQRSGPPSHEPPAGTTTAVSVPDLDRSARRLRLHHALRRRPRWSNELDELLAEDVGADDTLFGTEGDDYWLDTHMTLGVRERELVGAAA